MAMSYNPLPTMRRKPMGFAREPGAVGGISAVGDQQRKDEEE